jgi:hypothetical protein
MRFLLCYCYFYCYASLTTTTTTTTSALLAQSKIQYAIIHAQGFTDSPVSWKEHEHQFDTAGDNHLTIVLLPNDQYRMILGVSKCDAFS